MKWVIVINMCYHNKYSEKTIRIIYCQLPLCFKKIKTEIFLCCSMTYESLNGFLIDTLSQ